MQPLKLGAIICNISVSVGEKVTYLADSYDVPHLPTPAPIHFLQHLKPDQKQL